MDMVPPRRRATPERGARAEVIERMGEKAAQLAGFLGQDVALDEPAIKCPSPPNMLKYTYDHSCY